jgi:outer membrane immunogenic protein
MTKFLLGTTMLAGLLFAGAAQAADMPLKAQRAAPAYINWAGFYIGANAGWIGSTDDDFTLTGTDTGAGGIGRPLGLPPAAAVIVTGNGLRRNGFIGGGQIGYNWQFGAGVFGVEADFDGIGSGHSSVTLHNLVTGFVPATYTLDARLKALGTVRARLGFLATPSFLLYGTAGFAFGDSEVSLRAVAPTANPPADLFSSTSHWETGWTAGGGAEWMFAPRWSLKAEYLFVDLHRTSTGVRYDYGLFTSTLNLSHRERDNIVRAGVNYHF